MKPTEFETEIHAGRIQLPDFLKAWFERPVRVILLAREEESTAMVVPEKTSEEELEALYAFFDQFHADFSNYKFNRDEANER